jgi:hypothetical protein
MSLQTFRTREDYESWKDQKLAAGTQVTRDKADVLKTIVKVWSIVFLILAILALTDLLSRLLPL